MLELGYEGKRRGHYSRFTCPFHDDGRNPDFAVWDDICGANDYHDDQGYDGISLIMKLKGWDIMETLRFLSDEVGMEFPAMKMETPSFKEEDLQANIEKMIVEANRPEDSEPILREIAKLPSEITKDFYVTELGKKLKVTRNAIKKDLQKIPVEVVNAKDLCGSYTDEEIAEAKRLLEDPDILNLIIKRTEKAGHVGEQVNKKTTYLACTSRLLSDAISIVVKGRSSAGKNSLLKAVLNLFPKSEYMDYTGISTKSLFYLKDRDLSHKILVIYEAHGSEQADYAIRSSISERKLKLLVTLKNPETGRFESEEIEIDAEGLVYAETTTKSSLDPENQTRLFDLFIDESEELTRGIFRARTRKKDIESIEMEKRVLQAMQTLLNPYSVFVPFGEILAEKFPASQLRTRRDFPRFLALIESSALLHQYQRERTTIFGKQYLVATTEDYRIAYEIAQIILSQTLKELTPTEDRVLSVVKRDFAAGEFSIGDLRYSGELKNIPESTLRKAVKDLSKKGYFEWNGEKGKKSRYELLSTSKQSFLIPSTEELSSLLADSEKSESPQENNSANNDLAQNSSISSEEEDKAIELNQAKDHDNLCNPQQTLDIPASSYSAKPNVRGEKPEVTHGEIRDPDSCIKTLSSHEEPNSSFVDIPQPRLSTPGGGGVGKAISGKKVKRAKKKIAFVSPSHTAEFHRERRAKAKRQKESNPLGHGEACDCPECCEYGAYVNQKRKERDKLSSSVSIELHNVVWGRYIR